MALLPLPTREATHAARRRLPPPRLLNPCSHPQSLARILRVSEAVDGRRHQCRTAGTLGQDCLWPAIIIIIITTDHQPMALANTNTVSRRQHTPQLTPQVQLQLAAPTRLRCRGRLHAHPQSCAVARTPAPA